MFAKHFDRVKVGGVLSAGVSKDNTKTPGQILASFTAPDMLSTIYRQGIYTLNHYKSLKNNYR